MFTATVKVTLKDSVLDPQGQTALQATNSMGILMIKDVRVGKYFELKIDTNDEATARAKVNEVCEKLFANPIIEKYDLIDLEGTSA
ncbi:MAG: phosphoribosylformylglycinamidine synthase subunit PurS [Candidatus Omnitrophica bacterium]|nr:phosphoribosylformylglycinamidine synthase subunit PurS [Candidatus Omnitrophota bacterium]